MSRGYVQSDGSVDRYPDNIEEAKRLRCAIYTNKTTETGCKLCSSYVRTARERFTYNDLCVNCARLNAGDFVRLASGETNLSSVDPSDPDVKWIVERPYQHLLGQSIKEEPAFRPISNATLESFREGLELLGILDHNGDRIKATTKAPVTPAEAGETDAKLYVELFACKRAGHLGIKTLTGECYFCKQERERPSPRQAAIAAGERWYTPLEPCKRCGILSDRRVDNGACRHCIAVDRPEMSPRQAAIAAGERWYTPLEPCKRCGTTSPKRVDNGACSGCTGTTPNNSPDRRATADSDLMRNSPDLVLSRDDARALGFKVYRTGTTCRKGHAGYRYVSTGNCIDCLKERGS